MTKRVIWFSLAVLTTLLALVVLWQFRIASCLRIDLVNACSNAAPIG